MAPAIGRVAGDLRLGEFAFRALNTCFSAPSALVSRRASSIRVRHMAQRGGLTGSSGGVAGSSEGGMVPRVKRYPTAGIRPAGYI